jgi:hypothetical protein
MDASVTFTNGLGDALAPVLIWVRNRGFFEWYVFMPTMTAVSIGLFVRLTARLKSNGTFSSHRAHRQLLWLAAYFGLCFLATNVLVVAFKTLIVEELDYTTRVWFEALVGPLHFYIVSVVIAYLILIVRNAREGRDRVLGLYVQVGLAGGYLVCVYRVFNEPISLLEPTNGLSGFILAAYFAIYNYDLYTRLIGRPERPVVMPSMKVSPS